MIQNFEDTITVRQRCNFTIIENHFFQNTEENNELPKSSECSLNYSIDKKYLVKRKVWRASFPIENLVDDENNSTFLRITRNYFDCVSFMLR